ncbi:MAG: heme ABC transporter ATP-binding protein [Phaeodactylibacter sp.]|nr:heme ABC transporter ATP-binding protein [Phaeodactylibacter sp.]MCB9274690.1 heme ABC transporter ATP-binding protein [Lewinellaceae bacterium]
MLAGKNISYRIGSKKLLDEVSVEFQPGMINLIIGPNGAGKSTLIKILSGQLKPTSGEVSYSGRNIAKAPVAELAKIRAVLSQNIELAFPLSVSEVVMMGRYPHFMNSPTQSDREACNEAMRFFDVLGLENRNYMTLSGGEKQRVHFARVAAQVWKANDKSESVLLLDEPLTFLDVYYQFDFMEKLRQLVQQQSMVVAGVVHDLNLAGKYADHIVLIHRGKAVAKGSKEAVLTRENIHSVYGLSVEVAYTANAVRLHF